MVQKTLIITYTALTVAILFVGGYLLYSFSYSLAIPGSRFILMAPFLSFVFYFPLIKFRKKSLITQINVVLALVTSLITIFMGLAIVLSGLLTDLFAFLIFRSYKKDYAVIVATSFYPVFATLTSFYVTTYITSPTIFGSISYKMLGLLLLIIWLLGLFGSLSAHHLRERIFRA